jgi:hypothetical protein
MPARRTFHGELRPMVALGIGIRNLGKQRVAEYAARLLDNASAADARSLLTVDLHGRGLRRARDRDLTLEHLDHDPPIYLETELGSVDVLTSILGVGDFERVRASYANFPNNASCLPPSKSGECASNSSRHLPVLVTPTDA